MSQVAQSTKIIRTLPWGEEIYLEIPVFKKSQNKFYARHGRNSEGRQYLEFSKFGPKPNTEDETYSQKLRIYNPAHWVAIKQHVEASLFPSLGWDMAAAQKDFEAAEKQPHKPADEDK